MFTRSVRRLSPTTQKNLTHDPARSAVRRLAVSRFVSMAGTDATGVAIGFALFAQTHSPTWLSLSLMTTIGGGALIAPLGGRIGDMADRRAVMILCELAAAVSMIALALVHTPVALLALGLLATGIGAVFGPASGAALAHVAGERHLAWASSIIATGVNVGKTAGRLLGGVLVAVFGVTAIFALDALSFVASAWLIASVHLHFSAARAGGAGGRALAEDLPADPDEDGAGGIRSLLGHPTLRPLVLSASVSVFATAFTMTAEVPLVFEVGAGAAGLGALTACWAAGMVAGSWYSKRSLHRGNEITGVVTGRVVMAFGVAAMAAAPSLDVMLLCYLVGGAGGGYLNVAAQSLTMRAAPDHLLSRTLAAVETLRNVAFGVGVVGAGAAVSLVGARPVYGIVGAALAVGVLPVVRLVVGLGGLRSVGPKAAAVAARREAARPVLAPVPAVA